MISFSLSKKCKNQFEITLILISVIFIAIAISRTSNYLKIIELSNPFITYLSLKQPNLLFKVPSWEEGSQTAVKNQNGAQFEEKQLSISQIAIFRRQKLIVKFSVLYFRAYKISQFLVKCLRFTSKEFVWGIFFSFSFLAVVSD